jgi:hypothetical protein
MVLSAVVLLPAPILCHGNFARGSVECWVVSDPGATASISDVTVVGANGAHTEKKHLRGMARATTTIWYWPRRLRSGGRGYRAPEGCADRLRAAGGLCWTSGSEADRLVAANRGSISDSELVHCEEIASGLRQILQRVRTVTRRSTGLKEPSQDSRAVVGNTDGSDTNPKFMLG